jgi:ribulose-phosphate 3-epimerase
MQENKVLIAPSMLSADFSKLKDEIARLEIAGADILHLDVMDGHYVPNLTFGNVIIDTIENLTSLPLDTHLMVTNPADYVKSFAKLGVQYFSFHPETVYHPHRLIAEIKEHGMKAGVALNPGTPVFVIEDLLKELDFVLLMSVNPGYSGQSFIPEVVNKIKLLKTIINKRNLNTLIEVDGGVNNMNAIDLIEAGTDIIVSASYIFAQSDYAQAIRSLRNVQ